MFKIIMYFRENGKGLFSLKLGSKLIWRMKVLLVGNELMVLDSTAFIKRSYRFAGILLLEEVVAYARMHELKVIAISRFVQKLFSHNPALYADVWEKA